MVVLGHWASGWVEKTDGYLHHGMLRRHGHGHRYRHVRMTRLEGQEEAGREWEQWAVISNDDACSRPCPTRDADGPRLRCARRWCSVLCSAVLWQEDGGTVQVSSPQTAAAAYIHIYVCTWSPMGVGVYVV